MNRLLFVVHEPSQLRTIVRSPAWGADGEAERALCLVHGGDPSGLGDLGLQQRMTIELRAALGADAETIPTFVVSGHPGDDVDACAASWGATRVVR